MNANKVQQLQTKYNYKPGNNANEAKRFFTKAVKDTTMSSEDIKESIELLQNKNFETPALENIRKQMIKIGQDELRNRKYL